MTEAKFDKDKAAAYAATGVKMFALQGLGGEETPEGFATLMAMMAVVADLAEEFKLPSEAIHAALGSAQAAKEVILKEITKNG